VNADISLFLHGAITLACFLIGVKFLKFWRSGQDRFFLWFVAAFWVLACGWVIRAFAETTAEDVHYVFVPRLLAFLLIIAAILDKNRKPPGRRATRARGL
jgi:peptidoglycan/LPS O-acetylase OafA/YrhL